MLRDSGSNCPRTTVVFEMSESFDYPPRTDGEPEEQRTAFREALQRDLEDVPQTPPLPDEPPPPTGDERAKMRVEAQESRRKQEHKANEERWREVMRHQPLLCAAGELHPGVAPWAAALGRNEHPGNLVLAGPGGEGKTWNALHAVLGAYTAGFGGHAEYVNLQRWREARPASTSTQHDKELLDWWQRVDVLVLDDLAGKTEFTAVDREFLYMILDLRCSHRDRPTVVVSNVASLEEAFGGAVSARLREPSVTIVVFEEGYRAGSTGGGGAV
jgi:hypothetical protein